MKCFWLLAFILNFSFAFSVNAQLFDDGLGKQVAVNFRRFEALDSAESHQAKKAAAILLDSICKHFDLNGVRYTKNGNGTLFIKILTKQQLTDANAFNKFASQLSEKFGGLRLVVDPLKLKKDGATALYVEATRRLYLDFESILNLQASPYLGHELIHAKFHRLELSGVDHIYLGWLWPSDEYDFTEVGYEAGFNFDEIPAYYYQSLLLLKQLKRAPDADRHGLMAKVKKVLQMGADLSSHFSDEDIAKAARASLNDKKDIVFDTKGSYHLVQVTTGAYAILFKLRKSAYSEQDLMIQEVSRRLEILVHKASAAQKAMEAALNFLEQKDYAAAMNVISESKDVVLQDR